MTIPNELRPLLERIVKADASIGATSIELMDGWKAMAELRAMLAAAPAQGQQVECQERRAALLKVSRDADKLRAELAALKAQQVGQESEPAPKQHPDDAAVDRFAAAMKAKLARSREKGRHGWQNCTAPHLSAMLYDHLYKADPLDVGNFAMMLHQNGQAIELPFEARGRHTAPQPAAHHIEQALDTVTPAKS